MEKEKFYRVVNKLILPLFTGSSLEGEEESSPRDLDVALSHKTLLIKSNKSDNYRLIIKRSRPFQQSEINLIKYILKEISDVDSLNIVDSSYEKVLQQKAIEKAICLSISQAASKTLLGVITELDNWSNRTYEGRKMSFGIIINQFEQTEFDKSIHFSSVLNRDFSALLSDGVSSYLEFDKDGYLMNYLSLIKFKNYLTTSPNEYEFIARICNEKRIGLALTETGDLLVFSNRSLLFAKRKGSWNVYSHDEIIELLSYRSNHSLKDIRRAIYLTALDCSFAYTGGLLVYVNKEMTDIALSSIDAKDILEEDYFNRKKEIELEEANKLYNIATADVTRRNFDCTYDEFLIRNSCDKTLFLKKIIAGRKFQELSRKMREELVGMDGAMVIDFDGRIIAVGAILKIDAGSNEGGRFAAANSLAKCGVTIKISQDGQMQAFCPDKKSANKTKQLFEVK